LRNRRRSSALGMRNEILTLRATSPDFINNFQAKLKELNCDLELPLFFERNFEIALAKKAASLIRYFRKINITLAVYDEMAKESHEFVALFDWAESLRLRHVDFLKSLNFIKAFESLKHFNIGEHAFNPCSFKPAQSLQHLESLWIGTKLYDLEVIGELKRLKDLTLRDNKQVADWSFLAGCESLERVEFMNLGFKNVDIVSKLIQLPLRMLKLSDMRSLTDINAVTQLPHLETLDLDCLKGIQSLPDFSSMKSLKVLRLADMHSLEDVSGAYQIPNLEEVKVIDGRKLKPESFRGFQNHPTLKYFSCGFGTTMKAIREAEKIIPLPARPYE
jgi:hypothetical protein